MNISDATLPEWGSILFTIVLTLVTAGVVYAQMDSDITNLKENEKTIHQKLDAMTEAIMEVKEDVAYMKGKQEERYNAKER